MIYDSKPTTRIPTDRLRPTNDFGLPLLSSSDEGCETRTVLVVDDEPEILDLVRRRLEKSGFHVVVAADGITATQFSIVYNPDVVILDIGMPRSDGHSVAGRMRTNASTESTPIIFLTARTSDADRTRAQDAGAFAYITKPFAAEELVEAVNLALTGSDWAQG